MYDCSRSGTDENKFTWLSYKLMVQATPLHRMALRMTVATVKSAIEAAPRNRLRRLARTFNVIAVDRHSQVFGEWPTQERHYTSIIA